MNLKLTTKIASIIIPVYNGEKSLAACLDSVCNQNHTSYEVIVVDNASTDQSSEIISQYLAKYSFLKMIYEPQIGRGAARRAGELESSGEIILMTDADCIVPDNWIQEMIAPILLDNYDCVQGFEQSFGKDFWSINQQKYSQMKLEKYDGFSFAGYVDTKNFAIRKCILSKIGFTNPYYLSSEDTDLSIKLFLSNAAFFFQKKTMVAHRHPNNFKEVFRKQVYRGEWSYYVNCHYQNEQRLKKFRGESVHTVGSFFKLKTLFHNIQNQGIGFGFFIFASGLSWRIGILKGRLNYRSGKNGLSTL